MRSSESYRRDWQQPECIPCQITIMPHENHASSQGTARINKCQPFTPGIQQASLRYQPHTDRILSPLEPTHHNRRRTMLRIYKNLALAILFSLSLSTSASTCSFSKIEINPVTPENNNIFSGKSEFVEIRLNSEKDDANVSVFPEPPLIIINNKTGTECHINGGAWVRSSVFISSNTSMLATQEFSGSNDSLIFYSTATCRKITTIDISNATWELKDRKLRITRANAQGTATTEYAIDSKCTPKKFKPAN